MQTGLVSVTFRHLCPHKIITLAKQAGFSFIEWGGDIHVPNPAAALQVKQLMNAAGLTSCSYGSYYKAGDRQDFSPILATAAALGAPNIRVWAGTQGSQNASPTYYQNVVADLNRICALASSYGITIAVEYHGNTLTDQVDACLQLLRHCPQLRSYWQPIAADSATNQASLQALCKTGRLLHLHVYHWKKEVRLPLSAGVSSWQGYLATATPFAQSALLEFVKDDDPAQFLADAATLHQQIKEHCL